MQQLLKPTTCCLRSGSLMLLLRSLMLAPTGHSSPGEHQEKSLYSSQTQGGSFSKQMFSCLLLAKSVEYCMHNTSIFCQMSSCFLLAMKDDSIEGIYDTLKQCALISKSAGGIGVAVSCIRATGSYIAGVSFLHLLL